MWRCGGQGGRIPPGAAAPSRKAGRISPGAVPADPAGGGGSQPEGVADPARSGAGGSRRGGWKRSGSQEVRRRRGGCATHEPLLPLLQHGVEREHLEAATATTAVQYKGVIDVFYGG